MSSDPPPWERSNTCSSARTRPASNAVVYTLVANCRLHGVEPYEYLKDVLTRLPSATSQQLPDLAPRRWKAARLKQPAVTS